MAFLGFVTLGDNLAVTILVKNTSGTPKDGTAAPAVRFYGPSGGVLLTGTASLRDTGTVTGATNASPIVVTSAAHGLTTGQRVTVASVAGNTAANGDFTVTVLTSGTFSLDGSTGNGAYTSGGTWHASGLYSYTLAATAGNGFAAGTTYAVLSSYAVSGTALGALDSFVVT